MFFKFAMKIFCLRISEVRVMGRLISILFFLFTAISISEGLQCYVCYSNISWEHCEKSMTTFECPSPANEVCVKDHQKASNKNRAPRFSRHCGLAEECTNKHCMAVGIECDPHCCHSDLCNTASTAKTSIGYGSIAIHSLTLIIVYVMSHFP